MDSQVCKNGWANWSHNSFALYKPCALYTLYVSLILSSNFLTLFSVSLPQPTNCHLVVCCQELGPKIRLGSLSLSPSSLKLKKVFFSTVGHSNEFWGHKSGKNRNRDRNLFNRSNLFGETGCLGWEESTRGCQREGVLCAAPTAQKSSKCSKCGAWSYQT